MPPKRKASGKKKKKSKKVETELSPEELVKRADEQVESMQAHLVSRREITRRALAVKEEWDDKIKDNNLKLEFTSEDHKNVMADMTRQYKSMQTDLSLRVHQLETDLSSTKQELDKTQKELSEVKEIKEKIDTEKSAEIKRLQDLIVELEFHFERLINDAMDRVSENLETSKQKWEMKSSLVQAENKQFLLDFGINQLYI